MDNVQIEIQDSTNSILGVLDVGNVKNFPLSLTSSISDLRDITTRSGSFSTPFKVPSTKANDDLLEHIYLAEQKNYKDFDAEKQCIIRVNGTDLQGGKLQITKINSLGRDGAVNYSFKFFGSSMDWVLDMKGYKTKDLPYLNKTLTYDDASVQASWSNVGGTQDEVYSFINRGERISPNTVNVGDLRPDYFLLDYLESAFNLIGYNFDSTFFNTTASKQLMIPFFGKNFKILQSTITDNFVDVSLAALHSNMNLYVPNVAFGSVAQIEVPLINTCIATNNTSTSWSVNTASNATGSYTENSDAGGNFGSGLFTAPVDGYYKISGFFETLTYFGTTPENSAGNLTRYVQHTYTINSGSSNLLNTLSNGIVVQSNPNLLRETWTRESNGILLSAGDTLRVNMKALLSNAGLVTTTSLLARVEHAASSSYTIDLLPDMNEGDTYNWADKSDDKVEVFDIVMDVFRTFNCFIRTNEAIRTVYVEPRDDFYNDLSTATNKTNDIDDNTQIQLEYNSKTYRKNHYFDYAKDGNDAYLNAKNKDSDNNLFSYEHTFPDKFKDGTTNYKTKILAATDIIEDLLMTGSTSTGSGGQTLGAYTSRLWDDADSMPEHTDDFAPRLLYFNYGYQRNNTINRSHELSYRGNPITQFGYALTHSINANYTSSAHFYAAVDGSLSFIDLYSGVSNIIDGLWKTYFSQTSQEIETGKRVKVNLLFDLIDWANFDFREVIYFDNRYPELEGYWRYEKINGFKPTSNAISTSFNLIQARTFPSTASKNVVTEDPSGFRTTLPDGGGSRLSTKDSNKKTIIKGYDNYVNRDGNMVIGNNLRATGNNQLMYGMHNSDSSSDISTDLLQFGTGTEGSPNALIRVDQYGRTYFNGNIQGSGSIVDISTDTTADLAVETYLVDCTNGEITLTLPTSITPVGKSWNIKKTTLAGTMTITPGYNDPFSVSIDGFSSISETTKNASRTPLFDGTNFNII